MNQVLLTIISLLFVLGAILTSMRVYRLTRNSHRVEAIRVRSDFWHK